MERVGFFADDTSQPVQALEEQVLKKKLFKSEPAGLEIAHAGVNPGIGQGRGDCRSLALPTGER